MGLNVTGQPQRHFNQPILEGVIFMNNNIYAIIIRDYIKNGFSPIPVPFKTKKPITKGWNKLAVSANNFETYFDGTSTNIGILTGKPSGGLVDVDIDNFDALKFASYFLPKTNCIFGHESKPKSHWVYRVTDCRMIQEFTAKGMILEVRGNNRCTIFPGSIHPSGETIEFENPENYAPTASTWKKLKRAGSKIAIATELYKTWSPGIRHRLTLSVAAVLARFGWNVTEVSELVTEIARESNDEELQDRLACVESTFAEYAQGRPISGDESLIQLVGTETAARIRKWASSPEALKPHAFIASSAVTNPPSTTSGDLSTDSGAADAFATAFKNRLIYCNKEWFRRKNQVFEPVPGEIVQGLAKVYLQTEVGKVGPGPLVLSPLKGCLTRARINAAVELSRSKFHVEPDHIDGNIHVIGSSDGSVLELDTGGILRGKHAIVTKKLGANFTEDSSCPEWTSFLNRIFEDDNDLIAFVRRAVGYSLTGSVSEQCLFILIGTGANGKSTFVNTLQRLFGDYSASVPMQTLMDQRNGSAQTNDLAYLVGKRFVAASEGERGQRLAESKIKMMTGGDRISCRAMYKDFFEFDPQFKLWLATNNLPTISGTDDAIWRRIMVIPFPVTIPLAERDQKLGDRLANELPGICNWAMQGLREWRHQGLNPPLRVLQSTGNYREENDTVGQWIEAACVQGPRLLTTMKDLYESYKSWCENSSVEAMQNSCFGKELTRRGFKSIRGRCGNGRIGIGLKPSAADLKVA
jgi:putative DNA primase/helicase